MIALIYQADEDFFHYIAAKKVHRTHPLLKQAGTEVVRASKTTVIDLHPKRRYHIRALSSEEFRALRSASETQRKEENNLLVILYCRHPDHGYFTLAEVLGKERYLITLRQAHINNNDNN